MKYCIKIFTNYQFLISDSCKLTFMKKKAKYKIKFQEIICNQRNGLLFPCSINLTITAPHRYIASQIVRIQTYPVILVTWIEELLSRQKAVIEKKTIGFPHLSSARKRVRSDRFLTYSEEAVSLILIASQSIAMPDNYSRLYCRLKT